MPFEIFNSTYTKEDLMNKDLALLERQEIVIPQVQIDESELSAMESDDVLSFSEKELGYTPPELSAERARVSEQKKKTSLPLLNALKLAGIKPFTAESVSNYKKKMTREFRIITSVETQNNIASLGVIIGVIAFIFSIFVIIYGKDLLKSACWACAIGSVAFWLVFALAQFMDNSQNKLKEEKRSFFIIPEVVLVATLTVLSIPTGFIFTAFALFLGPHEKEWKELPLSGYAGHVPRFALETAKEIKTHCPATELKILQLTNSPDPFLMAVLKEECYHLEFWEKPKYKHERQA
jgi:hypothetical protein